MEFPQNYVLETENIKLNAYRLICLFYTNKEIARRTEPKTKSNPIARLEKKFFFREMSRLIISIAISVRIIDDQMKSLGNESQDNEAYIASLTKINGKYRCMMFDV